MPAGMHRHLITIQQTTLTFNASRGATDSWAEYATAWAKVDVGSGEESFDTDDQEQQRKVRFILRHPVSGITTAMRIVHNSKNYDIESVYDKDGTNRRTTIEAIQRSAS